MERKIKSIIKHNYFSTFNYLKFIRLEDFWKFFILIINLSKINSRFFNRNHNYQNHNFQIKFHNCLYNKFQNLSLSFLNLNCATFAPRWAQMARVDW